ncbi:MAG: hypothetical protein IPG64_20795 [Haliea sp.]|nr:hypothetical protein [Haliea sp.]
MLVTKHHDGYTLWPSAVTNPNRENWGSPGTWSVNWPQRCAPPAACALAPTTPRD